MRKYRIPAIILASVLIIDQTFKILVKTNMMLGQEYNVIGNWFRLHFTENNGMAFGLELAGDYGKVILTVFRLIAAGAILWYLNDLIQKKSSTGLIISITLILAGAIGNLLDSLFYGMIFNDSYFFVSTLFPPEGGYSDFLHGRVVDMLYFPILDFNLPHWFPFWPNKHVIFFRPVFNIADTSISTGVGMILVFQKRYFKEI